MNRLYRRIKEYLRRHRNSSVLRRSLAALACVVVFVTTYLLIYPAITLEKNAVCGQTEHSHTEACYEKVLVCGREEKSGHTHTESCYEKAEELECSLDEHTHSDACYDENGELICGQAEHAHGADCYQEGKTLTCGQEESEGHTHVDSCYEKRLTCGLQEHVHSVSCYGPAEDTAAESKDHVTETAGTADSKGKEEDSETSVPEIVENEQKSKYGCMESEIALTNDIFKQLFTNETGLWVYSADGTWSMTDEQTQIYPDTDVTVRLGFRLPKGTVGAVSDGGEVPAAHLIYELPKEIRITKETAKKVNDDANGYNQVILGARVPGEELADGETEYLAGKYTLKSRKADKEERKAGDPEDIWFLDLVLNDYALEQNQEEALDAWLTFVVKGKDLAADENGAGEVVFADDKEKHGGEKAICSKYHLSDNAEETPEEETGDAASAEGADAASGEPSAEEYAENTEAIPSAENGAADEFPAQTFHAVSDGMIVDVTAVEGTFPAGTTMSVADIAEEELGDAVKDAAVEAAGENKTVKQVQAVDITFCDAEGNVIEPAKPVKVFMNPVEQVVPEGAETVVVHVKDDGSAETMDVLSEEAAAEAVKQFTETTFEEKRGERRVFFLEKKEEETPVPAENAVAFEAEKFSVYAIVYTVDFEYEVDGKTYQFSLPGGGFASLTDLVEVLGIIHDTNSEENGDENGAVITENPEGKAADEGTEERDINPNTNTTLTLDDVVVNESTRQFVADVASVECSSPELVDVSKVENETTVGQIKEKRGLKCEYSAELTEEQIVGINAQTVDAGDWALISMKPFTSEETLTVTMKDGEAFMICVTDTAIHYDGTTTVHYGYVDEDGKFVEFPDSMKPKSDITGLDTSFGWHYLIYDFYGKEGTTTFQYNYSGTYYSASGDTSTPTSNGVKIHPLMRYYYNKWTYISSTHKDDTSLTNNNNWKPLNNDSDIYVVYEKLTITDGGSPTLKTNAKLPDAPDILKQSVENGDGTNTLSLSITGSTAPMEVEKLADVIVILDLSSSMRKSIKSEYEHNSDYTTNPDSRYYQAKLAIQNLADKLYERNKKAKADLYRMGLVTFSNDARVRQELTENQATFQSALDGIIKYESNGTNWEYALQLANEMSVDSGRATYVVFITDGEPTLRQTRLELKDTQLTGNNSDVNTGDIYHGGLYGGNFSTSNNKFRDYLGSATFGGLNGLTGYELWIERDKSACYDEVQSMKAHDKDFYAIGISNAVSVASLDSLVSQAGLSSDHSTVEISGDGLARAFETVLAAMDGYTGQANVQMYDGITGLTQTISKVNQAENRLLGADGNFTYWKSTKPKGWEDWTKAEKSAYTTGMDFVGSEKRPDGFGSWSEKEKAAFAKGQSVTFTEWTTREDDGCAAAVYNTNTKAVEWNMGDKFILEDGVTYKVSFICWPSQEAYDIIAKLNNGTIAFGDTNIYSKSVWDQFEGDAESGYTLKTNEDGANTKYNTATNVHGKVTVGDEQDPLSFQHVPPMPLVKDSINVAKTWQASQIDSQKPESVVMQVVGDGALYKEFEITPTEPREGSTTNNWGKSEDIYISCGHLKVNKSTGAVVVYESGHDFTLREVEANSRHWDLDASTCRPMKINNQPTMLVLVEGSNIPAAMTGRDYYKSGSDEYYRIGGKVYKDTKAWADLSGWNTRRSFLDLAKEVLVDNKVTTDPVDTKFTYKIKIDVDPTTLSWDPDLENYIIISIRGDGYTPAGAIADAIYPTTAKLPSQSGMDTNLIHEGDDGKYLVAETGVEFYLSIKNGWSVRFLNLPAGTTYSIEEVLGENADFAFNNVRRETRKDESSQSPLTSNVYQTKKLEGSIAETSTLYKVVYQNDAKTKEVQILKTGQDASTPLGGAVFDLYTASAYTSNPQGTPFMTHLTSSDQTKTKGRIDLGKLPIGTYYLVETKAPDGYNMRTEPVIITVSKTSVTYDDGTTLSQSGSGISQIGEVYQLKVTNDEGVALPSTGGPGTRLFTILGSILILGAGGLLWRRWMIPISL